MKQRFWVLLWNDGTYYAIERRGGHEMLSSTPNVLRAERFTTLGAARNFHDGAGNFYHQEMHAVRVTLNISLEKAYKIPARKHSNYDEDRS